MTESTNNTPVRAKRSRISSLPEEKRREILAVLRITRDYDYTAERCSTPRFKIQRADVLAVAVDHLLSQDRRAA